MENLSVAIKNDPQTEIRLNLTEMQIRIGDEQIPIQMPESARKALTTGQYDFLAQLLEGKPEIEQTATQLPYLNQFA